MFDVSRITVLLKFGVYKLQLKAKFPFQLGIPLRFHNIVALHAARDLKILINLETSETVYGIISEGVTSINLPYC